MTPITRLAVLVAHPEQAEDLSPADARALLPQLLALQTAVLARALAGPATAAAGDQLLTVTEAAQRLGVSRDWVYRRADRLPFTNRLGRSLRFSSRGLEAYLTSPPSAGRHPPTLRPS